MLLRPGLLREEPFSFLLPILLQVLPASPFLEETRGLMGKSDYELFKVCNLLMVLVFSIMLCRRRRLIGLLWTHGLMLGPYTCLLWVTVCGWTQKELGFLLRVLQNVMELNRLGWWR